MTEATDQPGSSSQPTTTPDPQALAEEVLASLGDDFQVTPTDSPLPAEPAEPVVVESTEPPPAAKPAPAAATPPAPAPQPPTPKPAAPAAAAEPAEPELPAVRHPFDLPDDPSLDGLDVPAETGARFGKLKEHLRSAREDAQFGRGVMEMAARGQMQPEDVADLIVLASRARQGDEQARKTFGGVLARLGLSAPPPAAPAPAAPAQPDLAAVTEEIYDKVFAARVKSLDLDEDVARKLAADAAKRELAVRPALSQPVPAPAPAPAAPPPAAPSQTPAFEQQMQAQAAQEVTRLETQFAEAYKKVGQDFAPVNAEVVKRINAMGRVPPARWAYEYANLVKVVQQERRAAAQKPKAKAPAKAPLTPSTNGAPPTIATKKAEIVDAIMSGNLDNLP